MSKNLNLFVKRVIIRSLLITTMVLAGVVPVFLFFNTKQVETTEKLELTPQRKKELEENLIKSLTRVRGSKNIELGVFIYTDNYTVRNTFVTTSPRAPTTIFDIQNDIGYSEVLDYHFENVCFNNWTLELDPTSKLYHSISSTEFTEPVSKYMACPIYFNDILIGYVATLFNEGEFKGLTPILTTKLQYNAIKFARILKQYI